MRSTVYLTVCALRKTWHIFSYFYMKNKGQRYVFIIIPIGFQKSFILQCLPTVAETSNRNLHVYITSCGMQSRRDQKALLGHDCFF